MSIRFEPRDGDDVVLVPVTSIDPAAADTSHGTEQNARFRIYTDNGILECSMHRRIVDRMRQIVVPRD